MHDIHLHVFCSNYKEEIMRRDNNSFELRFVHEEGVFYAQVVTLWRSEDERRRNR